MWKGATILKQQTLHGAGLERSQQAWRAGEGPAFAWTEQVAELFRGLAKLCPGRGLLRPPESVLP